MAQIIMPNQASNVKDVVYLVTTFLPSSYNPNGVVATLPVFEKKELADMFAKQNNGQVTMLEVPAGLKSMLAEQYYSTQPSTSEVKVVSSEEDKAGDSSEEKNENVKKEDDDHEISDGE